MFRNRHGLPHLSGDTDGKSDLLASVVWIRREAGQFSCQGFLRKSLTMSIYIPVRTNWPTVAEKPDRKALKGWIHELVVMDPDPLTSE
jgi:hypothetical protein